MLTLLLLLLTGCWQCATAQLQTQDPLFQQQQQNPKLSRWLLHDPGFPVDVHISPFGDETWTESYIRDQDDVDVLHIPSSLLNVTVVLPEAHNLTDVHVSISIFQSTDSSKDTREMVEGEKAYRVLADTQVPYAKSYRVAIGYNNDKLMKVRVYVEGKAGVVDGVVSDLKMRAFFVRTIDPSPSEAQYYLCGDEEDDNDVQQSDTESSRTHAFPPANMPRSLCKQYTMNGRVPIRKWYFDDQTDADRSYAEQSYEYIEELVEKARVRTHFYYGATDGYMYKALEKYPIEGKHVLIVGSTTPWYESICIAMNAASCTTIDYNKLRYHHPKIQTFTLAEFETSASRKHFDVIWSISSFEHDGLGRYGDPLEPDADLEAMKNLLQYAHPTQGGQSGTKLFVAVPVGSDCVVWNAQRIYGPLRLPLLVESWNLIDSFGFQKSDFTAPFTVGHQPIFVLEPHVPAAKAPEATEAEEHSEL
ncbi:hypothetical protein FI667_g14154, partial [Globisporangium splendens]